MAKAETEAAGLPTGPYVLLSEFVTWAIEGFALTDAQIRQRAVQRMDKDMEVWGSPDGPEWLPHFLKLIRDGHSAYPKAAISDLDYGQQGFERAQGWLAERGGDADSALADSEQELAQRRALKLLEAALEKFVFEQAAVGAVAIKARRWDHTENRAASEYATVPADFFLRPCSLFYVVFFGQRSELVRERENDGSSNWLTDSVYNRGDRAPDAYVEAKIARDDAIRLKTIFDGQQGAPSAESECRDWLIAEMQKSPASRPKQKLDFWREAKSKFPSLLKEWFDRTWKTAIISTGARAWSAGGRPKTKTPEKSRDRE